MKERVEIKKDQLWCSFDNEFIIEDYKEVNHEYWVFYRSTKTKIDYSCLEDAFRARFFPIVNKG